MERDSRPNTPEFIRNVIIGMADGLTVPFAIAAGLAGTHSSTTTTIIIAAMLAEIAAGSISMGLGGYLAAQTDADHFESERAKKISEVQTDPEQGVKEIVDRLVSYGLSVQEGYSVVESLQKRKKDWIDFIMHFGLGLEEPDKHRTLRTAATIGGSYIIGGFIPLAPYFFTSSVSQALTFSIIATALALVVFGYLRGKFVGDKPWKSVVQTVFVGGIAGGAAFLLARLVS